MAAPTEKLVLRRATFEQYLVTLKHNSEEWHGQLIFDDYIAREVSISQDSAMAHGHCCWPLAPESDPLDIRCSTESWQHVVAYCAPGHTKVVLRPALMFVSLYVPLAYRGMGYGTRM
jgi:hypothetical protein